MIPNPVESPLSALTLALAVLVLARAAIETWLITRQVRHVGIHRQSVPKAFEGQVNLADHQKAADYTIAKARLDLGSVLLGATVLLGWTLFGGLDALNTALRQRIHDPAPGAASALAYQVALLGAMTVIGTVIELPLDAIRHFRIEQRFGFNRMTGASYAGDALRGLALGVVVMAPLFAGILWLMGQAGALWWLWAFALLATFQLVMLMVYPTWIAPLFNRFTPLKDPALEARVRALVERCGFSAGQLLVMDGSRRSAHANAYFTGWGRSKRIVLFDTLLSSLTPDELEAVLAHELGHFRHWHVPKRLALMMLVSLAGLALLGWASGDAGFYLAMGVQPNLGAPNDGLALALFLLILPHGLSLLAPIASWWSRRQEFQADSFAAQNSSGQALARALVRLHTDNASTLNPDPWYARFHYSHPPAAERLAALHRHAQGT